MVSASDALEEAVGDVTSIDVRSLPPGTLVTVHTHNSRYRLIKMDGTELSVLVQGGRLFPDLAEGRVDGSTFGGNLLHVGSIDVGLFLELSVARERVVTSRVRSISVEPWQN
jgi:hypothetical protein